MEKRSLCHLTHLPYFPELQHHFHNTGVPADQLEQVQKTMREGNDDPEADIGLRNVYMRLNYFYGNGFKMEIGNNPEGGFKISILIPGKVEEDVHIGDRG